MSLSAAICDTWGGLLDLLYPPVCLVCGTTGEEALCARCVGAFHLVGPAVCARCGAARPAKGPEECAECRAGAAWSFEKARAPGEFEGALRHAILRLKYGEKRRLAVPLGAWLAARLREGPFSLPRPDVVVPVPLHPSRLRERGFNQAALLAREVADAYGAPLDETLLRRVRRTRPQAALHAAERAANVRDAFAATVPARLEGRTVLLVDDVLTTLHTTDECARVLSDAGARAVYVAGVARGG